MVWSKSFKTLAIASFTSFFISEPIVPTRGGSSAFAGNARIAIDQLQKSYNMASGLYGNLWWNTANVITMLADFQEYFPSSINNITLTVFPNTLKVAPQASGNSGFLNEFYDDELWWALAWIKVYDVTKDDQYLNVASSIFEDAKAGWGTSPCGGLW
jgi:hypothetical protein